MSIWLLTTPLLLLLLLLGSPPCLSNHDDFKDDGRVMEMMMDYFLFTGGR
jgi:hypothetical protein